VNSEQRTINNEQLGVGGGVEWLYTGVGLYQQIFNIILIKNDELCINEPTQMKYNKNRSKR